MARAISTRASNVKVGDTLIIDGVIRNWYDVVKITSTAEKVVLRVRAQSNDAKENLEYAPNERVTVKRSV